MTARARELGIEFGLGNPGRFNAITDVPGVRVGQVTLIEGDGRLSVGAGPVRTGVTVVIPRQDKPWEKPVFAAAHALNGNGELTGLTWLREAGLLMSPIAITNTHSVGAVRDTLIHAETLIRNEQDLFWRLPVVAETWDGILNDVNGGHISPEHVSQALEQATFGPVSEGNVGGGTGMICHGFKGGTGTSSRVLPDQHGGFTVGVLVQANHGVRERLTIDGIPVGQRVPAKLVPEPDLSEAANMRSGAGSVAIIVATDAPLMPNQCRWLAQRAGLGVARTGGAGEHWSGDIAVAFSTGNPNLPSGDFGQQVDMTIPITMLANAYLDPLYTGVIEATEEAIINALVAARTMTGRDGITAYQLDHENLQAAMT